MEIGKSGEFRDWPIEKRVAYCSSEAQTALCRALASPLEYPKPLFDWVSEGLDALKRNPLLIDPYANMVWGSPEMDIKWELHLTTVARAVGGLPEMRFKRESWTSAAFGIHLEGMLVFPGVASITVTSSDKKQYHVRVAFPNYDTLLLNQQTLLCLASIEGCYSAYQKDYSPSLWDLIYPVRKKDQRMGYRELLKRLNVMLVEKEGCPYDPEIHYFIKNNIGFYAFLVCLRESWDSKQNQESSHTP